MRKKINKKEWQWNKYNNTVGTVPCSSMYRDHNIIFCHNINKNSRGSNTHQIIKLLLQHASQSASGRPQWLEQGSPFVYHVWNKKAVRQAFNFV